MVEGKRCWLDLDKRIHNCRAQGGLPKASNIREAGYDGHCSSAHRNPASLMLLAVINTRVTLRETTTHCFHFLRLFSPPLAVLCWGAPAPQIL